MITREHVMLVQLAAQFFVLVALKLFSTVLIIILKFSIIKKGIIGFHKNQQLYIDYNFLV